MNKYWVIATLDNELLTWSFEDKNEAWEKHKELYNKDIKAKVFFGTFALK